MAKTFDYSDKYVVLEEGQRQYDDIDLSTQKIVEARYVRSKIPYDRGNMMIEALPRPREGYDEIFAAYNQDIGIFSEEEKKDMKDYEKMAAVSLLRQLRFPLPFHQSLEDETYLALLNSYRCRKPVLYGIPTGNQESQTYAVKLQGEDASATCAGFSLLGYSGCGKSSALEILFSNYPQTIIHQFENGTKITQIVYLVVNCVPNSNFAALYTSIGKAIDNALGYSDSIYENMIRKARNLGEKAEVVANLIEKLSIGIIVFDEIQLINFTSTKENSVEGLMTLANKTKVAMGVVGTEDAFNMLFSKLRTGRRFGETIIGHEYCNNKQFFQYIVKNLFQYQWFDPYVPATKEMTDALYQVSKGIIDQLIGVYIFMQLEYIQASKKPTVNADYVKKVAEKHYPGMMRLMNRLEDPVAEKKRIELLTQGNADIAKMITASQEKQKKEAEQLMMFNATPQVQDKQTLLKCITRDIMNVTDEYDMQTIMSFANKELSLKSNQNADERTLKKKVLKRLQNSTTSKPKEAQLDALHLNMQKEILE